MKIDFYFDWFAGSDSRHFVAYSTPLPKLDFTTRFKFTVEIPDPQKPDIEGEVLKVEEV